MFLIIFQFLNPIFLMFTPLYTEDKQDLDYIHSDLENFANSITVFNNNNDQEDFFLNFTYPGKISVITDHYNEDITTLLFRFSNNRTIYKEFQVSSEFNIEIENIFIKQYNIRFLNNSKFIIFI